MCGCGIPFTVRSSTCPADDIARRMATPIKRREHRMAAAISITLEMAAIPDQPVTTMVHPVAAAAAAAVQRVEAADSPEVLPVDLRAEVALLEVSRPQVQAGRARQSLNEKGQRGLPPSAPFHSPLFLRRCSGWPASYYAHCC